MRESLTSGLLGLQGMGRNPPFLTKNSYRSKFDTLWASMKISSVSPRNKIESILKMPTSAIHKLVFEL
jgi:hypothetical protein